MRHPLALSAVALLALLLTGCPEEQGREQEVEAAPSLPAPAAFHEHVLAVIATYPTDGSHRYHWPRSGSWLGTTRDLLYAGETLATGDPEGRCHCSGLTFEVFVRAWERFCRANDRPFRVLDLDLAGMRRFQRLWFGTSGDRRTLLTALTRYRLGTRVEAREDARPGDFVQLWRHSGSGHSCIFRGWVRDEEQRIVGLRYWSTQTSTNGIGERSESFGASGSAVKTEELYVVRVGDPGR